MEYYARVIQKLENELGLSISSFPDLNIYPVEGGRHPEEIDDVNTPYDIDHIPKEEIKEWYS
jgi:hypothetical protein